MQRLFFPVSMVLKGIIQNKLLQSAKRSKQKERWRSRGYPRRLVGLIVCLENLSELASLKRVQAFFTKEGASCYTYIYVKDKKMDVPEEFINEDTILLGSHSVNWFGVVRPGCAEYFLHETFDIIVNLSKDFFFPISYLVALSKAPTKVGRYIHPLVTYRLVLGANDRDDDDGFVQLLERSLQFIKFEQ